MKICIIDDNEAVCDAIKFLFASLYNLEVKIYNNPMNFLEEFTSEWDGFLLIDLFMPSINGIDLMEQIKKTNDKLHVIIMSGHASEAAGARALKAGAKAFISKPLKADFLLETINSILQVPVS